MKVVDKDSFPSNEFSDIGHFEPSMDFDGRASRVTVLSSPQEYPPKICNPLGFIMH